MNRLVLLAVPFLLAPHLASGQIVEYVHLDALGNVRAVTNQAGQVIERHDYLPFGEEWNPQPGNQPLRFTGKERDTETGFDYFGARYYQGKWGRFTTTDPLLDQQAALVDPQQWNRYAYGLNNPFRYVDPDGRNPFLLFQRIANSPAGQRVGQFVSTQWANIKMAGARLANSPAAQDALEAGVQMASGADLPPAPGPGAVVSNAVRFSQKGVSQVFQHGEFAGQTIEAVAEGLRTGAIALEQVPIMLVTRDGVRYAINNRSLMALRMAGFGEGVVKDVTGVAEYEARLTKRLSEIPGGVGPDFVPTMRPLREEQ